MLCTKRGACTLPAASPAGLGALCLTKPYRTLLAGAQPSR